MFPENCRVKLQPGSRSSGPYPLARQQPSKCETFLHMYVCTYVYIYICVCVCDSMIIQTIHVPTPHDGTLLYFVAEFSRNIRLKSVLLHRMWVDKCHAQRQVGSKQKQLPNYSKLTCP